MAIGGPRRAFPDEAVFREFHQTAVQYRQQACATATSE